MRQEQSHTLLDPQTLRVRVNTNLLTDLCNTVLPPPPPTLPSTYLATTDQQLHFIRTEEIAERTLIGDHQEPFLEGTELRVNRLVQDEVSVQVHKLLKSAKPGDQRKTTNKQKCLLPKTAKEHLTAV